MSLDLSCVGVQVRLVAFPAVSALISLACALVIAFDAVRRPRPDKVAWVVAFAVFAVAAGAEVVGSLAGWTVLLARVYYLTGATLVVGYLALGELYLLTARQSRFATIAPGLTLLVTAVAATIVFAAPVDRARLAADGWEAIERGPGLVALAATINGVGTVILAGGALLTAWRFWRRRLHRHRMIGCVLIAVGTLFVAAGGTLTRFGHQEYLYLGMSLGVSVIFAGYLEARRPTAPAVAAAVPSASSEGIPFATGRGRLVSLPALRGDDRRAAVDGLLAPAAADDPGIAFLEAAFLPLDDAALDAACRVWSVARRDGEHLSRDEAHRAWALRLRLSPPMRARFDTHGVPAKRQLAELYHDVLAPGVAELDRLRRALAP